MRDRVNGNHELSYDEIDVLKDALKDWSVVGGYETVNAYFVWVDKSVLPFAGGWLDQPRWIRDAFRQLNGVMNFHYSQKGKPMMDSLPGNMFKSMYTAKVKNDE